MSPAGVGKKENDLRFLAQMERLLGEFPTSMAYSPKEKRRIFDDAIIITESPCANNLIILDITPQMQYRHVNNPWIMTGVIGISAFLGSYVHLITEPTPTAFAPVFPTSTSSPTILPAPTDTPFPTETFTPSPAPTETATFTPEITQTPTETPTPIPLPFESGPQTIGQSVEGKPIPVYRFGTGEVERLIVADIHGGYEWNTLLLATQFIHYIELHPEIIPADVTLYILPVLNPDGEARVHGTLGRVNANGVDLNRNWDANWQKDWNPFGCWTEEPIHSGPYAASEPETVALVNFILSRHFTGIISYHSAGLGIIPGAWDENRESFRLAAALALIGPYPYPPVDTGCTYTGEFVNWATKIGIPSVDIELTNHTDSDFEYNLPILKKFLSWK